MSAACRYLENSALHVCTTKFGEPAHGEKLCFYEARAQLKDMERRGVNQRELRITGTLETGEPATVIVLVPRDFNWETPGP